MQSRIVLGTLQGEGKLFVEAAGFISYERIFGPVMEESRARSEARRRSPQLGRRHMPGCKASMAPSAGLAVDGETSYGKLRESIHV